ncbi:RloB family protein [Porphyromonas sp. COT-290 OH860]|uniref:RloB family protein n=1 Tax=Porphyromonas sp. COT-290 OH860 TaxID=1515615 RepID=UPI00052C7DD6|nr:RloB family protein [Porphyromonas sp. COT-290 OH860]KGN83164.1 hypothetical protein HQ41_07760 [Porphyromonas sp. COT-290 OH860]
MRRSRVGATPKTKLGRREGTRSQAVYFLIVSEGEKTEPNYFASFAMNRRPEEIHIEIEGAGRNTCSLVRYALAKRAELEWLLHRQFDRVWVVFDKDDFPDRDFNEAIRMAEQEDIRLAWSNQAFELWFLLHFELPRGPVDRREFRPRLEYLIQQGHPRYNRKRRYRYKKNATNMRRLLVDAGGFVDRAKRNARTLRGLFSDTNYAQHNPCTTVDLLVEELEYPELVLLQRAW